MELRDARLSGQADRRKITRSRVEQTYLGLLSLYD
jgi:hypothetical protein